MIANLQTLVAITLAVILIAISHKMSRDDEILEAEHYCEMVTIWNSDAERGIKPEDRAGWPPYRKEINCEKGIEL